MNRQRGWKYHLAEIIRHNNTQHASREKIVGHLTMAHRKSRLFAAFQQLRELGYRLEHPANIGGRHIEALVARWIAAGLAPATIQTNLSHLRVFCQWIGKDGMVRAAEDYAIAQGTSLRRTAAATRDRTWSGHDVCVEKTAARVLAIDPYVADQLAAQYLFGLRVKESILFRPWRCDLGESLAISDGTKGGRPRIVPLSHPYQRLALNAFKAKVRHKNCSLADPALTLKQAYTRYFTVMRAAGIGRADNGVTSHGLRHEFANALYQQLTGHQSPITQGEPISRELDKEGRRAVAEALGHSREQISSAYLGPILRAAQYTRRTPHREDGA